MQSTQLCHYPVSSDFSRLNAMLQKAIVTCLSEPFKRDVSKNMGAKGSFLEKREDKLL